MAELDALRERVREFVRERDWRQFHSPKNLAMALAVEAAELMEIFQWKTEDESRAPDAKALAAAGHEIADVLIYLVRIADEPADFVRACAEAMDEDPVARMMAADAFLKTTSWDRTWAQMCRLMVLAHQARRFASRAALGVAAPGAEPTSTPHLSA